MKARTRRTKERAERARLRSLGILRPGGRSRYAAKDRAKERGRGYSRRPTSPFFMSPAQLRAAGGMP